VNYCVLVKVSKRIVSFWYQSEKSPYAPLIIKDTNEAPLYFYVNHNDFIFGSAARDRFYSNDPNAFGDYFEIVKDPARHFSIYGNKKPVKQLFYYGIEQYLSHFINVVLYKSDSIESYRPHFPLRFLFGPDMEDQEKALVESLFTETGYDNVGRVDYNEALFAVLCEKGVLNKSDPVLLLTGVDNVLYFDLFKPVSALPIASSKLEGQGSDPRVKILADMIIEYITAQNSYLLLDKDLEMAALLPYAASMLENVRPIIKGEAILTDGKAYYFRVNERSLTDRLLFLSGDTVIYTAIDDLVKTYGLDIKATTILLASEEINTVYFSNKLLKKYPHVKGISIADELDAMKLVFSGIAASGYTVQNVSPVLPPIIPGRNRLKEPPAVVKPGMPPAKTKEPVQPTVKLPPVLPPKKNNEIINSPPLPGGVNLNILIGKAGIVTVKLSLTGKVEIDNKIYEAITEKNEIAAGTKVKVIGISGKKYLQVEKMALPPLPPKKNSNN
jgi:hypothetical protein